MTRFAISDPHRCALSASGTELGRDEPLDRSLRQHHPIAGEELADLHPGNTRRDPHLDLAAVGCQCRPRCTMTLRAVRANDLHHSAQHHIGELLHTATGSDTGLDRGVDITEPVNC